MTTKKRSAAPAVKPKRRFQEYAEQWVRDNPAPPITPEQQAIVAELLDHARR